MKKLLILLLLPVYALAQEQPTGANSIKANENELLLICQKLYKAKSDADKLKYNKQLIQKFNAVLSEKNSFENYHFDSLRNDIGILTSPDNRFRIINWHVPKEDGSQEYFGFIQENFRQVVKKGLFKKEIREESQLYELTDKSAEIKNPENSISDHKKWYGMLYYKIIPKKTKSKTYYTLLAWDGNDKFSQKKIIDVLTFDNNGVPKFGADIFVLPKRYPKRVIFEYSASCIMALKYSERKDSIVYDHLAPTQPQLEGQYQYYCGDMSYDGLGFKKGKWYYKADVQALNPKDEKDKLYRDPHDRSIGHDQSGTMNPKDKSINKKRNEENLKKEQKKK
jgi:hypothetical protein